MVLRKVSAARVLPIAFAWGPFVDVLEDLWHLGEGFTSAQGWITLVLDAMATYVRYRLARSAFSRDRGVTWRLALGVLLLGVAMRLYALGVAVPLAPLPDPLFRERAIPPSHWLIENLLFPTLLVAVHASLLVPMIGRRKPGGAEGATIAIAVFWAAFPSVLIGLLGWAEDEYGEHAFRSGAYDLRLMVGVVVPFVVAVTLVFASPGPLGYSRADGVALGAWFFLPVFCMGLFVASATSIVPIPSPYIATSTRSPIAAHGRYRAATGRRDDSRRGRSA